MGRTSDPQRRMTILQAARAIFLEQGYTNARMAEIADRAGVATGTVYLYFASKEALANAPADDFFTRLHHTLAPLLAQLNTPDGIATAVHTALSFATADHDLLRLLRLSVGLSPLAHPVPARCAMKQALVAAFAAHMTAQHIHQYDPQVLAELVTGMIEWIAEAVVIRSVDNYQPYETTVIHLLQRALL